MCVCSLLSEISWLFSPLPLYSGPSLSLSLSSLPCSILIAHFLLHVELYAGKKPWLDYFGGSGELSMDPLRSPTARRNEPLLVSAATLTLSSTLSSEHLLALWGSSCSAICQMPRCLPLLPFAQTLITMQAWGRWWFALIRL